MSGKYTVSVGTQIASEIKPVSKGNSIWANLEERDLDNSVGIYQLARPLRSCVRTPAASPRSKPVDRRTSIIMFSAKTVEG